MSILSVQTDPRFVYRPALDMIGFTEGTDKGRGYNETLAYGALTGGAVDLVGMTLDQVDALQTRMLAHPANEWNSSAVGRYQIVRTTLRAIRETLSLTGKEKFDAAMQDRMGCFLLGKRGIDLWLAGSMTDGAMINELAKEWASLPTERDVGYYNGQKAKIKSARVLEVLAQVRERHEAKDQSPDTGETLPAPSLPEIATIEAVTRLATMTPEQLTAAAMTIAMAQAMQRGWRIEDPQTAPATRTPGIVFTQPPTEKTDMNEVKSWYQSKGVIAGLASVAALIGPIFGLDLGQTNINDAIVSVNQLAGAGMALVSIWGRITAKSKIAGGITGKG